MNVIKLVCVSIPGCAWCEVTVSSTITDEEPLHGGESYIFTCITTTRARSNQLSWTSDDYIRRNGRQLILSMINQTRVANLHTTAILTDRYRENGRLVLVSELRITLQPQFYSSTVTCHNVGTGESASKSFTLAGK